MPSVPGAFAVVLNFPVASECFSSNKNQYNDILFGNIDAFGNAFERVQLQTEELSRINVNNTKTIANTAKENAAEFSSNRQREVYK